MTKQLTDEELISEFSAGLASHQIVSDPALIASYTTGWSGEFFSSARVVLKPESTQQVAHIVRTCYRHDLPLFIQGGNTGLAEASIPDRPNSVLLSLTGMNSVRSVDVANRRMTVDAGISLAQVQRIASDHGLRYAVDLAARDSATIGGTIATNAGGIRVIADGMTRDNLAGIEVVMPTGEIVSHLRGLAKDNTGYSLTHLFAGSEGTLGVITGATLILKEPLPVALTVFFRADSISEGLSTLTSFSSGHKVLAAEFIDDQSLKDTERVYGLRSPVECLGGVGMLVEIEGESETIPEDAFVALESRQARHLWNLREHVGMALRHERFAVGCDVSVQPSRLDDLMTAVQSLLTEKAPGVMKRTFGHLLDGNVHLLLVSDLPIPEGVDEQVLDIVTDLGGSISAEHGIGRIKVGKLTANRGSHDVQTMRRIKEALDPQGLLNPGVLFGNQRQRTPYS